MNFAENMKKRRKKLKLSQIALSVNSGVPQSTVSAVERGDRVPTADTMFQIAKGLHCSVDDLIYGEKEEAAASNGDGIKEEITNLLLGLSEDELQHMREYAEFLKSRRGKL